MRMRGEVRASHWARRIMAPAATALLLAPAALAGPEKGSWWRPVADVSKDGWRVEKLFWYTTIVCAIAFTLVVGALVGFSIKYRERPGHKALYDHGTRRASIAFTGILALAVFLSLDMVLAGSSQKSIKEYLYNYPTGDEVVRVEVLAQQWAWNFRYAGPDGKFNTADDVVTLNDMRIPVGKPVMVNLKSKDVIHSFYVPAFRVKHDANPGYVTRLWFQSQEPGKFEIACSQMCGWAHYKMRGELTALSQKDYEAWVKDASADGARRFDAQDTQAQWGWEWIQ